MGLNAYIGEFIRKKDINEDYEPPRSLRSLVASFERYSKKSLSMHAKLYNQNKRISNRTEKEMNLTRPLFSRSKYNYCIS